MSEQADVPVKSTLELILPLKFDPTSATGTSSMATCTVEGAAKVLAQQTAMYNVIRAISDQCGGLGIGIVNMGSVDQGFNRGA